MYVILMIFVLKTLVVSAENFSDETKYIDLLPEKEKQEFLERIARRIFDGVQSKDDRDAVSGEVSEAQMDAHDDFVQKILLEESINRRSDNVNLGDKKDDVGSDPKRDEDTVKGNSLEKKEDDAGSIDLTLHDSKRKKRYSFEKTSNNSKIIHVNVNTNEEKDLSHVSLTQDKEGSDAEDIQIKHFRRQQGESMNVSQEQPPDITTQRNLQKTQMVNFEDRIVDDENENDSPEENVDITTKESTTTQESIGGIVSFDQTDNINFGSTQKIFDSIESHHTATNSIENDGITETVEVTTNESTNPDIKTTATSCENNTTTESHKNEKHHARYHRSYTESAALESSKEPVEKKLENENIEDNPKVDKSIESVTMETVQNEESSLNTETDPVNRLETMTTANTMTDKDYATEKYIGVDLTTFKTELNTTSSLRTEEIKLENESNLKEVIGSVVDDSKQKQAINNKTETIYKELPYAKVHSLTHKSKEDNVVQDQNVNKTKISLNETYIEDVKKKNLGQKDELNKISYNLANDMVKALRSEIKPEPISHEHYGDNANINKNIGNINDDNDNNRTVSTHESKSHESLAALLANKLIKALRSEVKSESYSNEKNFKDLGALYETIRQSEEDEVHKIPPSKQRQQKDQQYNMANKENPYYVPIYNYSPENAYYNPHNRYGPNADDNEDDKIINNVEDDRDDDDHDDDKRDDNFNDENDRSNTNDLNNINRDYTKDDIDQNDNDSAVTDELKEESNSDDRDDDLERLLKIYDNYKRRSQRKFRFGNTKPRLNHKQVLPYKLNLPVVVQYPKFTDILLNPNDYLDMDYYYGRSMNSPLKRNRCEIQKDENIIPNSSEEGHPYNVMNDEQNLKNHISSVRQLMYRQKHFGYVPPIEPTNPEETQTAKEDDIEFSKEFLRTNEKHKHVDDKNIAMDYFFGRMNFDSDTETRSFVYKLHPSKNRLHKNLNKNKYKDVIYNGENTYNNENYLYNEIRPVTPSYFDQNENNKQYGEDNYGENVYIPYKSKNYVYNDIKPATTSYLDLKINIKKKYSADNENDENSHITYKIKNDIYNDNKPGAQSYLDEEENSNKLYGEDNYDEKSYIAYKSKNHGYNDIKPVTKSPLDAPQYYFKKTLRQKKKKEEIKPTDFETIKQILSMTDPKDLFTTLQKLLLLNLTVRAGVDVDFEPYVTVIGDMVRNDAKALKQYDWLTTTVDIQSALFKMMDMTEKSQNLIPLSEPDLQLLKYVIYLHKSVKRQAKDFRKNQLLLPRNKNRKKRRGVIKESGLLNRHWLIRMMENTSVTDKVVTIDDLNDFDDFLRDLQFYLYDLHTAVKQISMITRYDNQQWFKNLKELYLDSSKKHLLEILLHITTTRLLDLIEDSAKKGAEEDFLTYISKNEKVVERTKEEIAFALNIIDNLELQR